MFRFSRLLLIGIAVVWLAHPAIIRAQQEPLALQIYRLARALHYDDIAQQNFTFWVYGNMGKDGSAGPQNLEVGEIMPDFSFPMFTGTGQISRADLKPPYLLNFWASWCPPCRDEFPLLAKHLQDGTLKQPLVFIDVFDAQSDAETFLKTMPGGLTITVDTQSNVASRFGLQGIPVTILVDASGKIQAMHLGNMTEASIAFFSLIAAHPGVGAFESAHPDQPPAALYLTYF